MYVITNVLVIGYALTIYDGLASLLKNQNTKTHLKEKVKEFVCRNLSSKQNNWQFNAIFRLTYSGDSLENK